MLYSAEHIEQPDSGKYLEKIYDISSPWNSSDWTWIKFEDETGEWCGEFRGKYRGVSVSKKLGIVVVLTSDYMFILDINSTDIIKYDAQPDYMDITTSPNEDILITNGYGIEIFKRNKDGKIETVVVPYIPIKPDNLKFVKWNDNVLEISCYEFLKWEKEIVLYLDCDSMEWIDNLHNTKLKDSCMRDSSMDNEEEIKTLKYIKRTKYIALLYFFFCFISIVAVYKSLNPVVNTRHLELAVITILLWTINPMVCIVSLLGLKTYFTERKNLAKRKIIGKRWIALLLWNVAVILAWYISLFLLLLFTNPA